MDVISGIKEAFSSISGQRFFVSEADFQHSLAIELHKIFNDTAQIILEFPIKKPGEQRIIHIDIMVIKDGDFYPIELKYKTRPIKSEKLYENTKIPVSELLADHKGNDDNCYHVWADINRIEWLIDKGYAKSGVCIFISNNKSFWYAKSNPNSMAYAFRTTEGEKMSGWHKWNVKNDTNSKHLKDKPDLFMQNAYNFQWQDFCDTGDKYGQFKSLFIEIPPKNKKVLNMF